MKQSATEKNTIKFHNCLPTIQSAMSCPKCNVIRHVDLTEYLLGMSRNTASSVYVISTSFIAQPMSTDRETKNTGLNKDREGHKCGRVLQQSNGMKRNEPHHLRKNLQVY